MARPPKPVAPPAKKPRKAAPKPLVREVVPVNVLEAVQREVASLPASLRGSALALTALHLGDVLTKTDSARDVATIAKELRACLEDLAKAFGNAGDKGDAVDDIKAQREKRRAKAGM